MFDDMIADMLSNKKLNPLVTELLIRGWKLKISGAMGGDGHNLLLL